MSRTSRVKEGGATKKVWNLAKYIRKSKEEDDSRSIKNQESAINTRINSLIENDSNAEYRVFDTYIDEDDTGTDSNRENFQRLLKDLGSGKVNMIIVADSSRLSRNTSESLYYIQSLFVMLDIRFVSLQLPALDTYLEPDRIYSIEIPFQSVFNEKHCQDTSEKVRRTFNDKRKRGEFIGAFPPYGYLKSPNDKHKFIIDEEAAAVVRNIYKWFIEGMSKIGITKKLNDLGIPPPSQYKKNNGMNYKNPATANISKYLWSSITVTNMLKNQTYIGSMVQGRYRVKSYKIHKQIHTSKDEWFIVENQHEPIIDIDTFEKAQKLQERDTRTAPGKREVYLFSGFLKCADCNKSMSRTDMKGAVYYYCKTYKEQSKSACTKHTIRHDELEKAVLTAIQKQIDIAVSYEELIDEINKSPNVKRGNNDIIKFIQAKKSELEKIKIYKMSLYQSLQDNTITHDEYSYMQSEYQLRIENLEKAIENLNEEKRLAEQVLQKENPALESFKKHRNITELSREILLELVERIVIFEGKRIIIRFNFKDEFRRLDKFVTDNVGILEQKQA